MQTTVSHAVAMAGGDTPGLPPERARAPVVYHSSALAATDPALVAKVDEREVAQSPSVRRAAATAEAVRETFKRKGRGGPAGPTGGVAKPGSGEAAKADRYDRRLEMNRHSAAASRVRREAYIKALENELTLHDRDGDSLKAQLAKERAENEQLRSILTARSMNAPPADAHVVLPPEPDFAAQVAEPRTAVETTAGLSGLPRPPELGDRTIPCPFPVKSESEPVAVPGPSTEPMIFDGFDLGEDLSRFPTDPADPFAALSELLDFDVS